MKTLKKTFKYISILMLAVAFFGCEDDDTLAPKVEAGFTYTLNIDTGTVTFINISTLADTYSWDFGDDTSSTLVNPVHTYANGTYTVTLVSSHVSGSKDTFTDEIVIAIPNAITLPLTFDAENTKYEAGVFGGAAFEILVNPDLNGTNTVSSNVGAITNIGAEYEGVSFNLDALPIDLTTDKTIKLDVWSETELPILLKLEKADGSSEELTVNHLGTGWEELSFVFESSETFTILTLFVDGPGTTTGTFYIDDIMQIPTVDVTAPVITLVGDATVAVTLDGTFADPGATAIDNVDADITANIVVAGDTVDTSTEGAYVITYNVSDAAGNAATEVTRTVNVTMEVDTSVPVITLNGEASITITVGGTFTDEGATATDDFDGDISSNIVVAGDTVDTNTAGTYVITYNVSDAAGNAATEVTRSVIVEANNSTCSTILDFENMLSGATPDVFESSGELIANPVSGGINTSSNVYEIAYTSSNQWWGGAGFLFENGVVNDQTTKYTVKLYSTVAPTNVLFQVEVGGTNTPVGDVQTITTANEWVEVTFTLTGMPSGSNRVLVRPDVGTQEGTKPNTGSLYIDDIQDCNTGTGGGGGGTDTCPAPPAGDFIANGDFEAGDVGCWEFFAGSSLSTTVNNGGSNSAELQGSANVAVGIKQERFSVGSILPNTTYSVSFDIIASGAFGDGGVLKAFTFSEGVDGGSVGATQHILTDSTTSISTSWETKTYTFTTPANANQVEGGLSFLIEIVNSSVKLNIDNVSITAQ